MKITRSQLRQLIAEAARTIIVDPEGVATPADVALSYGTSKDARIAAMHPKIRDLMRQGVHPDYQGPIVGSDGKAHRKQGRVFADTLGFDDPLTPSEEVAVDDLGFSADIQDNKPPVYVHDIDSTLGLIKSKSKTALKKLGVMYGEDIDLEVEDDDTLIPILNTLGCEIQELALVPQEGLGGINHLHYALLDYFYQNSIYPKKESIVDSGGFRLDFDTFEIPSPFNFKIVQFSGYGFSTLFFCGEVNMKITRKQ